jgi:hypothetical protein
MKFCLLIILSLSIYAEKTSLHPYEILVCDYLKFELYKVDRQGKIIWQHKPEGKVWDFVLTKDTKLIYPIITGPREIRCLNMKKEILWSWPYAKEYREIINITQDKSQLIISGQKPSEAIIMTTEGELKHKTDIPTKFHSHHGELGNVYPLENGHFLVQLWGEGCVLELDHKGKETWRYQVPKYGAGKHPVGCVQDVIRLSNGNTLIACGTQARIIEVTPEKNIVWQLTKDDYPELNLTNACALQVLKDGSIFVTNFLRGNTGKGAHAFILSKNRKLTWSLQDHKNIRAASLIRAIEP